MREADLSLVRYFREKYGPFMCQLDAVNEKTRCDFCGNPKPERIIKALSETAKKYVYLCLECNAARELLGQEALTELMFESAAFFSSVADRQADIEKQKYIRVHQASVVGMAAAYRQRGLGSTWRMPLMITSIMNQFKSGKILSDKQINVLKTFNTVCERELADSRKF